MYDKLLFFFCLKAKRLSGEASSTRPALPAVSDSPAERWQPATDSQERRAVQSAARIPAGLLRQASSLSAAGLLTPKVLRVASACGPASSSKDRTAYRPWALPPLVPQI